MMLGIAWKWQAEVHGGFGKPLERRLATLEVAFRQGGAPNLEMFGASRPRQLQPGARLIRIWTGERHEVQVAGRAKSKDPCAANALSATGSTLRISISRVIGSSGICSR